MKYYTFNNREDFERTLNAVRTAERLDREAQPAQNQPLGVGAGVVIIRVTGPRVGAGTDPSGATEAPAGEELADETDYYPARPYYFNPVDKTYYRGVESPTSTEDKCYAHSLNDEDLVEGTNYLGFVSGYANGFAVVKVLGAVGGGASACEKAISWGPADCILMTVPGAAGRCSGIDITQELTLSWKPKAKKWKSGNDAVTVPEDDFVHDLGLGPVEFWFVDGEPKATIDGIAGMYAGCDGDCLLFRFGGDALCDGAGDGCEDNTFTVKFCCVCCDDDTGYTTPGWYCFDTGCEELAAPPCGRVVRGGPYATQEECEDACCDKLGWAGAGWYCVRVGAGPCFPVELLTIGDLCDVEGMLVCSGPYATEAAAVIGCACAECDKITSMTVTVAGVADGPFNPPMPEPFDPCRPTGETSGFGQWNGTWPVTTGTWIPATPPYCGYWEGGADLRFVFYGNTFGGGGPGTFCGPTVANFIVMISTNPFTGETAVEIQFGTPDPEAGYRGVMTGCCGEFTLALVYFNAGVWPGSVTVTTTCGPGGLRTDPPAPDPDETHLRTVEILFQAEALAALTAASIDLATADPGLGEV